ncbi:MAG: rRNA synthase [Clostridiales bacterium]|jgi:23S rRNA pseudouridine1911/1915/1917 synthase|nr:rRNA synthase [Clostridiales bacterium]
MYINTETLRLDYKVESSEEGLSVIDVAATSMGISSRLIRKCKQHKNIFLNGVAGSVNRTVHQGDVISFRLDHDENTFDPEPMTIRVLYEDGDVLVINKPPFLVVHPTKGHPDGTLANGLSHYQYERGEDYKARFINRLDRDTSGVLIVGKNAFAQQTVAEQMQANEVEKYYYTVVVGEVADDRGTIDLPIERETMLDIKRSVTEGGAPSVTHYEVVERFAGHTLLRVKLETGRTHQIRVHLSHIGYPVMGDTLYGTESPYINRQALHCASMTFKPPRAPAFIEVKAPLPEDLSEAIRLLRGAVD